MHVEKIIDEKFKNFFEPGLHFTIVQKILSREVVKSDIEQKVFDILSQSVEKDPSTKNNLSLEEQKAYYTRAYKTNPTYVWKLYNTYKNTDSEDLTILQKELPECLHTYNKSYAILELE
jgi:hypothetical protein